MLNQSLACFLAVMCDLLVYRCNISCVRKVLTSLEEDTLLIFCVIFAVAFQKVGADLIWIEL